MMHFLKQKRFLAIVGGCSVIFCMLLVPLLLYVSFMQAIRILFGSVLILFMPGFFLTLIFFPKHERINMDDEDIESRRTLDIVERVTFSIVFSIILSSAVVYFLSNIGFSMLVIGNVVFRHFIITLSAVIGILSIISFIIWYIRRRLQ